MIRQTSLSHHVIQFARFLRTKKFKVGPDEVSDALQGLELIDWKDPTHFKAVLQTAFCKSFDQIRSFDRWYRQYWSELSRAVDSKTKKELEETPRPAKKSAPSIQVIKNWLHGNKEGNEKQDLHRASSETIAGRQDLMSLRNDYHKEWDEIIQLIQRRMAKRKTRRMEKSRKPNVLDFRKILKASISKGGEIDRLVFQKKKKSRTNLLLICDISKSMELYSKFMIQLMYALQHSTLKIQCFVFSTSLYSVSSYLKRQSLTEALQVISEQVDEWSSGTQIGTSLHTLLETYGRKVFRKHTYTFVISDGWDAGDIDVLTDSMKKIKRRSEQVIWINPLATNVNYDPQVLGMKAARPYIDQLIPALDAQSLKSYLRRLR